MKGNGELQDLAKRSLTDNWGQAVGVTVIFLLISGAPGPVPFFGWAVSLLLAGPMCLGVALYFLALVRSEKPPLTRVLEGFNNFVPAMAAYLLMVLFVFLWCLLLIIPGIVAALGYAMTFFILADNPKTEPAAALRASKEMMKGNRWKLFCLGLRFIGWAILSALTFGIGFLFLIPYVQASLAHFYEDLKGGEAAQPAQPAVEPPMGRPAPIEPA